MAENKFTPGPWEVGASKLSVVHTNGEKSKVLAKIRNGDTLLDRTIFEPGEAEANACIMAAAPDLLEALVLFTQSFYKSELKFRSQQIAFHKAEAAIKKAKP